MNVYLSLLIFNPLEAIVLFWAALGDYKKVFRKENIKHFYLLGAINFIFQYLLEYIPGILNLFSQYFTGIVIMSLILFLYLLYFYRKRILLKKCMIISSLNLVVTAITVLIYVNIWDNFLTAANLSIMKEIIVNLTIRIIQFLLLYFIYFWRSYNEKE